MSNLSPMIDALPWMTVIPDRSPRIKAHPTRGQAFSALAYPRNRREYRSREWVTNYEGALYEWVDGEWVERWSGFLDHDAKPWKAALDG